MELVEAELELRKQPLRFHVAMRSVLLDGKYSCIAALVGKTGVSDGARGELLGRCAAALAEVM